MDGISFDDRWAAWAFNCNNVKQQLNKSRKNLLTQAGASVDIMLNSGLDRDIKMTEKINKWALADPEWARRNNVKYATIFNIEAPLDKDGNPLLGSTMDFREAENRRRMAIGYESVGYYFDQLAA